MAFVPRIKKYLAKSELVHGTYYAGSCRNAEVARWNANTNQFVYQRRKFDFVFADSIEHPEDFQGTDVFYPQKVCEPEPHQIVTEGFPEDEAGE